MANDTIKSEDLEVICRICLQRTDDRIDLFSPLEGYSMVATAIMECAPIQITLGDNLPNTICQNCIMQLDVSYRFRMLCVQSDSTLRQVLSQSNNDIKQETDFNENESIRSFPDETVSVKDEMYSSDIDNLMVSNFYANDNKKTSSQLEDSDVQQLKLTSVGELKCKKCLSVFKRKYHLQRHEKLCGKGKSKRRQRKSQPTKDEDSNFSTEGKDDTSPLKLKMKLYATFKENIQREENGRYSCRICHKTYTNKYHTARHAIVHSDYRFDCPHCDKSFVRPASLREHINVHTGKRSYNCEFCGKIFRTDSAMNTHRRIHLGVRPYKCDVCERTFTQNKTLKNHMRTHTGERPFVCETCGRSFNRKHILKTHTMIHTGERPHRCEICDRTFICKQHLQLHMVKHTGEPASSFRCSVCDKRFHTHQLKLKHEMEVHNLNLTI